jgi:hypothetical protein
MSLDKYQGAIRATGSTQEITFGVGSDYLWESAPAGLGVPSPEYQDSNLPGEGMFGGSDKLRKRIIRVPIVLVADDLIETRLNSLKSGWRPSDGTKELDLRFEGSSRRYYGRARGLEVDFTNIRQGVLYATGNFEALDPYGYSVSTANVNASSTGQLFIPNFGSAPTRRCVLTLTGNSSIPAIQNRDDLFKGYVRFQKVVASSQQRRINLMNFRIFTPEGQNRDSDIRIDSTFFRIEPSVTGNEIVFNGCQSISATIRYAYL